MTAPFALSEYSPTMEGRKVYIPCLVCRRECVHIILQYLSVANRLFFLTLWAWLPGPWPSTSYYFQMIYAASSRVAYAITTVTLAYQQLGKYSAVKTTNEEKVICYQLELGK